MVYWSIIYSNHTLSYMHLHKTRARTCIKYVYDMYNQEYSSCTLMQIASLWSNLILPYLPTCLLVDLLVHHLMFMHSVWLVWEWKSGLSPNLLMNSPCIWCEWPCCHNQVVKYLSMDGQLGHKWNLSESASSFGLLALLVMLILSIGMITFMISMLYKTFL
jgi:hypothetical protein